MGISYTPIFLSERIMDDISNGFHRSTGYREIKTFLIKVMSRSELKFFINTFLSVLF